MGNGTNATDGGGTSVVETERSLNPDRREPFAERDLLAQIGTCGPAHVGASCGNSGLICMRSAPLPARHASDAVIIGSPSVYAGMTFARASAAPSANASSPASIAPPPGG